jgi:hypothetical protein
VAAARGKPTGDDSGLLGCEIACFAIAKASEAQR